MRRAREPSPRRWRSLRGGKLPLATSSPLFAREVERVHATLQARPRGAVRFVPCRRASGDARRPARGRRAPCAWWRCLQACTCWRAAMPSGETAGGLVEVVSGKEVRGQGEASRRRPGRGARGGARGQPPGRGGAGGRHGAGPDAAGGPRSCFGTVSRTEHRARPGCLPPRARYTDAAPRAPHRAGHGSARRGPTAATARRHTRRPGAEAGVPTPVPVAPRRAGHRRAAPRPGEVPGARSMPASAPKPAPPSQSRPPLTPRKPLVRP